MADKDDRGRAGEQRAAAHLQNLGYTVLDRNWRCEAGELDIVAARGVDLLLSEAAFEEGRDLVEGIHMTGRRAGVVASEAGVGRLLLTHLQPWTNPVRTVKDARAVFAGDVETVQAGGVYEI